PARGWRWELRTELGERCRDVAERELRQRRARHVSSLRADAKGVVDEHLTVLRDEHGGAARCGVVVLGEERVDRRELHWRAINRAGDQSARVEVVAVARVQREERASGIGGVLAVVDERLVASD